MGCPGNVDDKSLTCFYLIIASAYIKDTLQDGNSHPIHLVFFGREMIN